MARITDFFNTQQTQSSLIAPLDLSGGIQAARQNVAGNQQVLAKELSTLDQLKNQERRANLIAQESQLTGGLKTQADLKLADITLNTVGKLATLDEAQRAEDVKKEGAAYLLNSTIGLQEAYLKYNQANQASGSGKGYAEATNKYILDAIKAYEDKAPSEEARIDFKAKAEAFRVNVMEQSFNKERAANKIYREGLISDAANKLSNQAALNPLDTDSYLKQADSLAGGLLSNGMSSEDATKVITDVKSNIRTNQISSLIMSNDPRGIDMAKTLLGDSSVIGMLPNNTYRKLINDVVNTESSMIKTQAVNAERALNVQAYLGGVMQPSDKNFTKAAADAADAVLWSKLPAFENNTIVSNASNISQYLLHNNQVLDSNTSARLKSALVSGSNPAEVVSYALAINNTYNDPSNRGIGVINNLDGDTFTGLMLVASLSASGASPKEVVDLVREKMRVSATPIGKERIHSIMKEVDIESIVEDSLDSMFSWYPTESGATIAQQLKPEMEALVAKWGSADLAAQAMQRVIKSKYAVTNINGKNEIMEGAPEMFFHGDMLDKFNTDFKQVVLNIPPVVNGMNVKPGLRAIPGMTLNQVGQKDYLIVDTVSGIPLTNEDGSFKTFSFATDEGKVSSMTAANREAYAAERDQINNNSKLALSNVIGWAKKKIGG